METRFTLTTKEMEMMDLLWDAGEPLSRAEILQRAAIRPCSWKPSSVHIIMNALISKGAVRVEGITQSSRKLSRTYGACLSRERYCLMQAEMALEEGARVTGRSLPELAASLRALYPGEWEGGV